MSKKKLFVILFSVLLFLGMGSLPTENKTDINTKFRSRSLIHLVYGVDTQSHVGEYLPKVITVNYEGAISKHISTSPSPVFALVELGYPISNMKKVVSTSPMNTLYNNSYIYVFSYRDVIDDIKLDIPFQRIVQGGTLCKRLAQEVIEQRGVLGIMSQSIRRIYERGELVTEEILDRRIESEPRAEIVVIKGPNDSPKEVPQIGYNCEYWSAYIDTVNATDEEKRWLKFIMKLESGCNAENNGHPYYKGLFQWDPCLWYEQYPNDNIFDGRLQIKHTLDKLRAGANPNKMWPAVHKRYVAAYGELSWL